MKKIIFIIISILLFGCDKIKDGKIISKWHESEYTYIYLMPMPIVTTIGKTTTTSFIFIPMVMIHPESWGFRVYKNVNNKNKFRDIWCSENIWNKIEPYDYWQEGVGTTTQPEDKEICKSENTENALENKPETKREYVFNVK